MVEMCYCRNYFSYEKSCGQVQVANMAIKEKKWDKFKLVEVLELRGSKN